MFPHKEILQIRQYISNQLYLLPYPETMQKTMHYFLNMKIINLNKLLILYTGYFK